MVSKRLRSLMICGEFIVFTIYVLNKGHPYGGGLRIRSFMHSVGLIKVDQRNKPKYIGQQHSIEKENLTLTLYPPVWAVWSRSKSPL